MKKIMLQTMLLVCLCMASCSDIEDNKPILPPDQEQEEPVTSNRPQDYEGLINKTYSVSADYGGKSNVRAPCVHFKLPPVSFSSNHSDSHFQNHSDLYQYAGVIINVSL